MAPISADLRVSCRGVHETGYVNAEISLCGVELDRRELTLRLTLQGCALSLRDGKWREDVNRATQTLRLSQSEFLGASDAMAELAKAVRAGALR